MALAIATEIFMSVIEALHRANSHLHRYLHCLLSYPFLQVPQFRSFQSVSWTRVANGLYVTGCELFSFMVFFFFTCTYCRLVGQVILLLICLDSVPVFPPIRPATLRFLCPCYRSVFYYLAFPANPCPAIVVKVTTTHGAFWVASKKIRPFFSPRFFCAHLLYSFSIFSTLAKASFRFFIW